MSNRNIYFRLINPTCISIISRSQLLHHFIPLLRKLITSRSSAFNQRKILISKNIEHEVRKWGLSKKHTKKHIYCAQTQPTNNWAPHNHHIQKETDLKTPCHFFPLNFYLPLLKAWGLLRSDDKTTVLESLFYQPMINKNFVC